MSGLLVAASALLGTPASQDVAGIQAQRIEAFQILDRRRATSTLVIDLASPAYTSAVCKLLLCKPKPFSLFPDPTPNVYKRKHYNVLCGSPWFVSSVALPLRST